MYVLAALLLGVVMTKNEYRKLRSHVMWLKWSANHVSVRSAQFEKQLRRAAECINFAGNSSELTTAGMDIESVADENLMRHLIFL